MLPLPAKYRERALVYLDPMSNDDLGGLLDATQMGRGGGLIAILVGTLLVGAGVYLFTQGGGWLLPTLGLGALGITMIAVGILGYRRAPAHATQHMPRADLRRVVKTEALGFTVCTRCHVVMPGNLLGTCSECGWPTDCVIVTTEAERSFALSSIPSD